MAKKQKWVYFTLPHSQLEDMGAEEILEVLRYDRAAPVELVSVPRGSVGDGVEAVLYWLMRVDATDMNPTQLPTAARMRSFRVTPIVAGTDQAQVKLTMEKVVRGQILLSAIHEQDLPIRV